MRTLRSSKFTPFSLAILMAVVVGLSLGSAFPRQAEAANFWELWFDIPAGGSTGQNVYQNCGWHAGSCDNLVTGSALDWDANADSTVYFAGAARWNSWYVTNAAYVNSLNAPYFNGSLCNNTLAPVQNWYTGNVESVQVYTHSTTTGVNVTVYAYSSPWPIRTPIGTAVYPDLQNWPTSGLHMHVYGFLGLAATNTGGFLDVSQCHDPACDTKNNQTWVHYDWWNY